MIRSKSILGACLGIVSFAALLCAQTPQAQVVAVRAGRLFDSKSGQLLANQLGQGVPLVVARK